MLLSTHQIVSASSVSEPHQCPARGDETMNMRMTNNMCSEECTDVSLT